MKSVGLWVILVLYIAAWGYLLYMANRKRLLRKTLATPRAYGEFSNSEQKLIREFAIDKTIPDNTIVSWEKGSLTFHHFDI